MHIDFLLKVFEASSDSDAIVWRDEVYQYDWLLERVHHWMGFIHQQGVEQGAVTVLESDFSPDSVALFLALVDQGAIVIPLTDGVGANKREFEAIAEAEVRFRLDREGRVNIHRLHQRAGHPLYRELRRSGHPGLVLFSSGSTGKSKAAVHDLVRILEKFKVPKRSFRTIAFLLFDHIGGLNTMMHTLSNASCLVVAAERTPDEILATVERHRVELLPTSPTFIKLILLSEAYRRYDLSSLKLVTYGTEPMPEGLLKRFHEVLPEIDLKQTYGLSEVGILRSRSKSPDSLWFKIGGEGFETRIQDGILQIRAQSAMLGYLNHPSPLTPDGWLNTGDEVELDGEYIRILGRRSELINVGGEKVYPAEVENVLEEMDNVAEASVYGDANPIMGKVVCARVRLKEEEALSEFKSRMKRHCASYLERYKVPVKVTLVGDVQHSERFKKMRAISAI